MAVRGTALGVLLLLAFGSSAHSADKQSKSITRLSFPGKGWSLLIDLPEFKILEKETRRDKSETMILASNRKTDLVVSVFLESDPEFTSKEQCKDHYWGLASQSPLPKSQVEHVSTESMAIVRFLVKEHEGIPNQKHTNAYMYRDGVCIDVHLSKAPYAERDSALFATVLQSIRYSDE
jgi:hypothetical protein